LITIALLLSHIDAAGTFVLDILLEQLNFDVVTIGDEPDEIIKKNKKAPKAGFSPGINTGGQIEMNPLHSPLLQPPGD